jgi:hypothetical protein
MKKNWSADSLLLKSATVCSGSFAHCRIFESGRSAAILLTSLVEILQWPLAPISVLRDEFSE